MSLFSTRAEVEISYLEADWLGAVVKRLKDGGNLSEFSEQDRAKCAWVLGELLQRVDGAEYV